MEMAAPATTTQTAQLTTAPLRTVKGTPPRPMRFTYARKRLPALLGVVSQGDGLCVLADAEEGKQ